MAKKISKISLDILKTLLIVGLVAVAATSPYFLLNLAKVLKRKHRYLGRSYNQKKISQTLSNLKRSEMVLIKKKEGQFVLELTEKGKKMLRAASIDGFKNKIPKQWDGFWRIVIFDIPEHKKIGRNALRGKMKELGFYKLQKSVWVFPYDCEKEIELLTGFFDVSSFVNLIEAKRIKDDKALRSHFKLVEGQYKK